MTLALVTPAAGASGFYQEGHSGERRHQFFRFDASHRGGVHARMTDATATACGLLTTAG